MKKNIQKIGILLLCVALLLVGTAFASSAENEKVLDLYVIAGQSNASGYSKVNTVSDENDLSVYRSGFDNIYMYGRADAATFSGAKVAYGQGMASDRFGAEIGMADKIAEFNSGNTSVIFKYAVGGTYLVNNTTNSFSTNNGNWCPPSMCKEGDSGFNAAITGKLFRGWQEQLTATVQKYQKDGYTVRLCGTFWMQGEAESGTASEYNVYDNYLEALIGDMRSVYSSLKLDNAKKAPFVIGKISSTFNNGGGGVGTIRDKQDAVAKRMADQNVYAIESYTICENGTYKAGCFDFYHFNGDDMLALGKSVGETMLDTAAKDKIVVMTSGKGTSNFTSTILKGTSVDIILTPNENYYISSAELVNSDTNEKKDVLDQIKDGVYKSEATGHWVLNVTFAEMAKYAVKITNDKTMGKASCSPYMVKYYTGTTVKVTVQPEEGYEVARVLLNGTELTATDGEYIFTVTDQNDVTVEYNKTAAEHKCEHVCDQCGKCTDKSCTDAVCAEKCEGHETKADEPKEGGNFPVVPVVAAAAAIAVVAAIVIFVISKKKKNQK